MRNKNKRVRVELKRQQILIRIFSLQSKKIISSNERMLIKILRTQFLKIALKTSARRTDCFWR